METLFYAYLLVGAVVGLVIWWVTFSTDYDQYVKETFNENPPSTREKWVTILSALLLWPAFLWFAFK